MSDAGSHHVTAFAGPVARNRKFYTETLGLRLVKTTVNFDDPSTPPKAQLPPRTEP